jgi:plasmid maintenance system antidote protein VapI
MTFSYAHIKHESSGSASNLMHQLTGATNLNASGLAQAMEVAPSTITRILHEQVCPSYDDMIHYAHCLGFVIEDNEIIRIERLRGYRSPKEIGDFVNTEFEAGITEENLDMVLRFIPKAVNDWNELAEVDRNMLMAQPARIDDVRFQALIEGAMQYVCHSKWWQDAPSWTNKTKLKKIFVPRSAAREIGKLWYDRILMHCVPEFLDKNVLFAVDEMMVI